MVMRHELITFLTFHVVAAVALSRHPVLGANAAEALSQPDEGLNRTAVDLFERSRRSYERTYPPYGRIPAQVSPDALTLDFEIETSARVKPTPRILLERGGIDKGMSDTSMKTSGLVQDSGEELEETVWPKLSDWFTPGMDGTGCFMKEQDGKKALATRATGAYRQDLSGQIELESIMMTPKEAIESNFTNDLHVVLEKLYEAKQAHADKKPAWYKLPFQGSKGISIYGSQDPNKPCNTCHVQFTTGLPLQHVTPLLRMTGESRLKEIIQNADVLCLHRKGGCRPEYHALISLAAWVVRAAKDCTGCSHIKRCMAPWLVRTHFGDLAMMLKEKFGETEIKHIPADVMTVGHFSPSDRILPHGTLDYLRLPEMAELSGMVFSRNPSLHPRHLDTEKDMPSDSKGLTLLAKRMLKHGALVNSRLRKRTCRLHGRDNTRTIDFTVKDFLEGMQHGKDLMSDHDSPLSQSAFSHMVWKSMGSWRMKPGSDRVYLECRSAIGCIGNIGMPTGPSGLIQAVAHRMRDFEHTMRKKASHRQHMAETLPSGQVRIVPVHKKSQVRKEER